MCEDCALNPIITKISRRCWRRKIGPASRDRVPAIAFETWVNQKVACVSRAGGHHQGCGQGQKNEIYGLFHRQMGVLASPVLLQGGNLNALLPASPVVNINTSRTSRSW